MPGKQDAGLLITLIPLIDVLPLTAMVTSANDDSLWKDNAEQSWHRQDQSKNEPGRLQDDSWFRAIAESSFDAVYLLSSIRNPSGEIVDFEFLDLNEQGAKLLSRHRKEVIHQRLCELLPINRTLQFFDRTNKSLKQASL